jgi:hypothetical protein
MLTGTARPGLTSEGSRLLARPQMLRSYRTRSPSGAVTSHPADQCKRIAMIKMRASDRDSTSGISLRAGHEGRSLDGMRCGLAGQLCHHSCTRQRQDTIRPIGINVSAYWRVGASYDAGGTL